MIICEKHGASVHLDANGLASTSGDRAERLSLIQHLAKSYPLPISVSAQEADDIELHRLGTPVPYCGGYVVRGDGWSVFIRPAPAGEVEQAWTEILSASRCEITVRFEDAAPINRRVASGMLADNLASMARCWPGSEISWRMV